MTPKRAEGEDEKPATSEAASPAALAQREALQLLERSAAELQALSEFVADEQRVAKRKAPSPKRLARLRLVSEDIASAVKLSSKSFKG